MTSKMILKRLNGGMVVFFVGALTLAGCGSDDEDDNDDRNPTPDAGGPGPGADTGVTADGGGTADAGMPDGTVAMPDTGVVRPPAGEGDACDPPEAPGMPFRCPEGLECIGLGEDAEGNPINACLRVCASNADCMGMGSALTPPAEICGWLGSLPDAQTMTGTVAVGWCVQELVGEGEIIQIPDPSLSTVGARLRDCNEDTARISISDTELICVLTCETMEDCLASTLTPAASICSGTGTCVQSTAAEGESTQVTATSVTGCPEGLITITHGDGYRSCARECDEPADCTTPGIGFCARNQGRFGPAIDGLCLRREGLPGTPCNTRNITLNCDLNSGSRCLDLFGLIDNDDEFNGICSSFCGDIDGDSATPAVTCPTPLTRPGDPTPTCVTRTTDDRPLFGAPFADAGICSDGCTVSPNSCGGTEPTACFSPRRVANFVVEFSQCITPAEPTLPIWNRPGGLPTEAEACVTFDGAGDIVGGRVHRCPEDTYCTQVADRGMVVGSGCIVGCNPAAPSDANGCEGKTIGGSTDLVCTPLNATSPDGLCEPM